MNFLNWVLRVALFILLLGLAVKNDQPITLKYFFGYEWQSPLVVVLLVFFAVGAVVGVVSMLGNVLRQRREIARLKQEIKAKNKLNEPGDIQQKPYQLH